MIRFSNYSDTAPGEYYVENMEKHFSKEPVIKVKIQDHRILVTPEDWLEITNTELHHWRQMACLTINEVKALIDAKI